MEIPALLNIVSEFGGPVYFTLTITFVISIFIIWLYTRKINVQTLTSIGSAQNDQLQTLNTLIVSLAEQLTLAREEIGIISQQNTELRLQIIKLENILIQNDLLPSEYKGAERRKTTRKYEKE